MTQIAAGDGFGLALRSDGTVWAWGWNRNGVLGDGTPASSASDVPVQVPGLSDVIQIAAGDSSAMAVRVQARRGSVLRTVWTWGNNAAGQLGNGTTTTELRPVKILDGAVTAISAGQSHALALLRGASVLAWGYGLFGTGTSSLTPKVVPSLAGVTQISAGDDYSLAVHQVVLVFVPGGVPGSQHPGS